MAGGNEALATDGEEVSSPKFRLAYCSGCQLELSCLNDMGPSPPP